MFYFYIDHYHYFYDNIFTGVLMVSLGHRSTVTFMNTGKTIDQNLVKVDRTMTYIMSTQK